MPESDIETDYFSRPPPEMDDLGAVKTYLQQQHADNVRRGKKEAERRRKDRQRQVDFETAIDERTTATHTLMQEMKESNDRMCAALLGDEKYGSKGCIPEIKEDAKRIDKQVKHNTNDVTQAKGAWKAAAWVASIISGLAAFVTWITTKS